MVAIVGWSDVGADLCVCPTVESSGCWVMNQADKEEHNELAGFRSDVLEAISNPLRILEGGADELLVLREIESRKFLAVVYRELGNDGFIITAFFTRRIRSLNKRRQRWP